MTGLGGLFLLSTQLMSSAHMGPFDRVVLVVSADQQAYYVGEPIRLTATIRNEDEETILGRFHVGPCLEHTEIYYRVEGTAVRRFSTQPRYREFKRTLTGIPIPLKPKAELKGEIVLAFDLQARELVLKAPGTYEFEVVQRVSVDESIRSNTVVLQVAAAPIEERALQEQCSRERMALLAQFDPVTSEDLDPQTVRDAAHLIDRHPSSPYAQALRRGLNRALRVSGPPEQRDERGARRLREAQGGVTPARAIGEAPRVAPSAVPPARRRPGVVGSCPIGVEIGSLARYIGLYS